MSLRERVVGVSFGLPAFFTFLVGLDYQGGATLDSGRYGDNLVPAMRTTGESAVMGGGMFLQMLLANAALNRSVMMTEMLRTMVARISRLLQN